jgi:hypothetical protein
MKKMLMSAAVVWVAVAVGLLVPPSLRGQDTAKAPASEANPPLHFYRLNLTVEEVNEAGKVGNSRGYVATVGTGGSDLPGFSDQHIRTGSRIPILTGSHNGGTDFQYVDVGVNFDVRQVREIGDKVSFRLVAEISSLADDNSGGASGNLRGDPVIRQNRWDSVVLIPVGKPTVVFSADDLDSKGKMQVEVTATRVE